MARRYLWSRYLWPTVLVMLITSAASAQPSPVIAPTETDAPIDSITDIVTASDRITIPVSIGGRGPFSFVIDTGSERTVIAAELATRLGLVGAGTIRVHSISGEQQVPTVTIPKLDHATGMIEAVRAPSLLQRDLGADGILGLDSLAGQRLTIDFRNRSMSIVSARKRQEYWGSDVIVVRARRKAGQLILADASAEDQRIDVILDTGAEISIGNLALRDGLAKRLQGRTSAAVTISSVTGGEVTALYTTIRRIRIGAVTVTDMPVAFADVHPFKALGLDKRPALLLGMDALALFDRVSVDFANRKARFDLHDAQGPSAGSRLAGAPAGTQPAVR